MITNDRIVMSQEFANDINKIQEIKLFKHILSTYDGGLEDITKDIIDEQKESMDILTTEAYLDDDTIYIHLFDANLLTDYSTVMYFYRIVDTQSEDYIRDPDKYLLEDLKFAFIVDTREGSYADITMNEYTHNWIYLNLKGFDIKCKFIMEDLTSDSTFHVHSTVEFDDLEHSGIQQADIKNFKDRLLPLIQNKAETKNPLVVDGTYHTTGANTIKILPDGKVISNNQVIFTPEGHRISHSQNNLNILKQTAIAVEDKILDV